MADRFCGTIDILKSDIRRYPRLAEAIKEEFFYDLPADTPLNIDKHVPDNDDAWDENSPIAYFKNDEARYGHFEDIENICKSLHVPYDRWSNSAFEYDAETAYSRPDINNGNEVICNGNNGERMFTESELWKLVVYNQGNESTVLRTIDMKATANKFIAFLNSLPAIRLLEEYEGYKHNSIGKPWDS